MAATKKDIELQIHLSADTKAAKQQLDDLYKKAQSQGIFNSKEGRQRSAVTKGSYNILNTLAGKESLNEQEAKQYSKAFNLVLQNLLAMYKDSGKINSGLADLVTKQTKIQNQLNRANTAANTYLRQNLATDPETGELFPTKTKVKEFTKGLNIHKIKTDGTPYAQQLTDPNRLKATEHYLMDGKEVTGKDIISKVETYSNNLVKDYQDLSKAAKDLKEQLQKLTSQISQTSEKSSSSNIEQDVQALSQITASGNTSFNKDIDIEVKKQSENQESGKVLKEASKQQTLLGRAFQQYTLYNVLIRSIRTSVNSAIKTITSLDKSLTEQAMVTGKTRQQTYKLLQSYQELASQLGTTSSEVASVVTKYMQQGKTTEESLTLATAAISAAKVAGIDASQSIDYLTTALNGFQLSSSDAMEVSDKFAAIAANAATSYEEIATALSKVASQANSAGMSIDYTTALLAKGLETTREAPETIGTALKTIIARMRELSDYGETLSDGVDVNNVETQLAYIGISLRNASGELRSTEDVLNELGLAWDNLSSNQQAAVAKALAGTRQQSRLIAMMSDYDRTLELQNISLQASGATAAQSEKYLQGMEAAINKVKVAWEEFTSVITDSDFLVGLVNGFGTAMEFTVNMLSHWQTLIPLLLTGVAALTTKATLDARAEVAAQKQLDMNAEMEKIQEAENQVKEAQQNQEKANNDYILTQKEKQQATEEVTAAKANLAAAQNIQSQNEINKKLLEEQKIRLQIEKQQYSARVAEYTELRNKAQAAGDTEQAKQYQTLLNEARNTKKQVENNLNYNAEQLKAVDKAIEKDTETVEKRNKAVEEAQNRLDELKEKETKAGEAVTAAKQNLDSATEATESAKNKLEELKKSLENSLSLGATVGKRIQAVVKQLPGIKQITKWGSSIKAAATAAGVSVGALTGTIAVFAAAVVAVAGTAFLVWYNSLEQFEKRMNNTVKSLNNAIYTNTSTISKLKDATDAWDDYNEELIHTKDSADQLAESLETVKDSLTDEQQETYEKLTSPEDKVAYLKSIAADLQEEIEDDRKELLKQVYKYQRKAGKSIWDSDNTDLITNMASGLKSNINSVFNKTLNGLDIETATSNSILSSFQSLLGNVSNQTIQKLAEDSDQITKIANQMANTFVKTSEEANAAASTVLASDSYTLQEKIDAYNALANSISSIADKEVVDALAEEYQDIVALAAYSQETIDYLSQSSNYTEMLNDVNAAFIKVGKSTAEAADLTKQFYEYLATDQSVSQAIDNLGLTATEAIKVINAFDSATGITQLNMGQNLTSWENTISAVYENAAKWNEMTRSEQAQYMAENSELFSDANMLKAFQSGNYNQIYEALLNNDTIQEGFKTQLSNIEEQIEIEEARIKAQQEAIANKEEGWEDITIDTQYLDWLKEQYSDYYDQLDSLAQASLETRKSQQDSALSAYKEYLQAENDATEDALTKRKEAYQNYFDAINEAEEDQDYEEEANQIIANMSKVGVSADASSQKQLSEMEQSLEDLEEERLDTLRERAQEALVQDIDDQIDEMNDTLDELLDNERALLASMTGQWDTEEGQQDFVASMLQSKINEGATAMEIADYLNTLQSTYGYGLDSINWDSISAGSDNNTTVLNIGGEEITLTSDQQQDLYSVIKNALRQIGIGGTTYGSK